MALATRPAGRARSLGVGCYPSGGRPPIAGQSRTVGDRLSGSRLGSRKGVAVLRVEWLETPVLPALGGDPAALAGIPREV